MNNDLHDSPDLEARLRAAAPDYPQPSVTETAWLDNQRRLDGVGGAASRAAKCM